MQLTFMWKTTSSQSGECPALYQAERDGIAGYVVQGKILVALDAAQMRDVAADEAGVWINADVLDRLVDERLAARGTR